MDMGSHLCRPAGGGNGRRWAAPLDYEQMVVVIDEDRMVRLRGGGRFGCVCFNWTGEFWPASKLIGDDVNARVSSVTSTRDQRWKRAALQASSSVRGEIWGSRHKKGTFPLCRPLGSSMTDERQLDGNDDTPGWPCRQCRSVTRSLSRLRGKGGLCDFVQPRLSSVMMWLYQKGAGELWRLIIAVGSLRGWSVEVEGRESEGSWEKREGQRDESERDDFSSLTFIKMWSSSPEIEISDMILGLMGWDDGGCHSCV